MKLRSITIAGLKGHDQSLTAVAAAWYGFGAYCAVSEAGLSE